MKFKVNVNFQGIALLEIEAGSAAEAVKAVDELTMADLARPGHSDVIQLKLAAREAIPLQDQADGPDAEAAPGKKRPSGWYLPS